MDTNTTVIIVVVVVALLVAAAVWWALSNKRKESRRAEATHLRTQAAEHAHEVGQREALAAKTAAQARAAQAEADAKAAEAAGLQHKAQARRTDAASARETVNEEFDRANKLDPDASGRRPDVGNNPNEQPLRTPGQTFEGSRNHQAGAVSASKSNLPPQDVAGRQRPGQPHDQQPRNTR